MNEELGIKDRDLQTLAGIIKGPGFYPLPSPDRIKRLTENGLIKKVRGIMCPTIKGRMICFIRRWL
jgi:hypothetical protein